MAYETKPGGCIGSPFISALDYLGHCSEYNFRFYFKGAQFKEHVSAKNMVAVVTGCDCGIGKQIVRELCLRGAKVYMMCRNEGRALNAQLELVKVFFVRNAPGFL